MKLPAALAEGAIDLFVFASPSSVRNFCNVVGHERAIELLSAARIASIGPTTARAVTECSCQVAIEPEESSIPNLVAAICAFYETLKREGAR